MVFRRRDVSGTIFGDGHSLSRIIGRSSSSRGRSVRDKGISRRGTAVFKRRMNGSDFGDRHALNRIYGGG